MFMRIDDSSTNILMIISKKREREREEEMGFWERTWSIINLKQLLMPK